MTTNDKVKYLRAIKDLMEADLPVCTALGECGEEIIENKRYEKLPNLFQRVVGYLVLFERKARAKSQTELKCDGCEYDYEVHCSPQCEDCCCGKPNRFKFFNKKESL